MYERSSDGIFLDIRQFDLIELDRAFQVLKCSKLQGLSKLSFGGAQKIEILAGFVFYFLSLWLSLIY